MNIIQKTALTLTIIGGINWLLVGIFKFDLVADTRSRVSVFTRVIYTLVGLAALINIVLLFMDLDTPRDIKRTYERIKVNSYFLPTDICGFLIL